MIRKPYAQKQQCPSPSLQPSLRCHTLAFFAAHLLLLMVTCLNVTGQIPVIQTPQPANLSPNIQIGNTYQNTNQVPSNTYYPNCGSIDQRIHEQNQRTIEEANNITRAYLEAERRKKQIAEYNYRIGLINNVESNYANAFNSIKSMLEGNSEMSLKKAVFIVEHAYNNTFTYEQYDSAIQRYVEVVKLKMSYDKTKADNSTINLAIAKVLSDTITFKPKHFEKETTSYPIRYDFDDGWGENDWNKMFVSKLLFTGTGQCHSMPLLYLIIAEELGASAYLSFSPNHSYIKFKHKNAVYNFETTQGTLVSDKWVMASGYINTESIKNKVFMDTLNKRQVVAHCLNDLAMGYIKFFGYGDTFFPGACTDLSLKYFNKGNAAAHVIKNNCYLASYLMLVERLGVQSHEDALQNPTIKKQWDKYDKEYQYIKSTGYKNIPKDKYNAWLQTARTDRAKKQAEN